MIVVYYPTVRLPHRPCHVEPALSQRQMIHTFITSGPWMIDEELTSRLPSPQFDESLLLWDYVRLVNFIILRKTSDGK